MTTSTFYALSLAKNLASTHRLPQAIELLTDTLEELSPNAPLRADLLHTLARLQIDLPSTRKAARRTLQELAKTHSQEAQIESLWLDYYSALEPQGLLSKALSIVPAIHQAQSPLQARYALSLGKVFTDLFLFDSARDWLLFAIASARQQGSLDLLAAASGALAEVFYRAGALLPALELIELDAALLPAGSLHTERLQVYRAHCYRQCGHIGAARGLYHQAYQAAQLRGFGQTYPLRGLIWCDLLDLTKGADLPSTTRHIQTLLHTLEEFAEPHSLACAYLASSWLANFLDDPPQAASYLNKATQCLEEAQFRFEAAWARKEAFQVQTSDPLPAPPDFQLLASDLHLAKIPLLSPQEHWNKTQQAFQSKDPTQPPTWMGFFF